MVIIPDVTLACDSGAHNWNGVCVCVLTLYCYFYSTCFFRSSGGPSKVMAEKEAGQ